MSQNVIGGVLLGPLVRRMNLHVLLTQHVPLTSIWVLPDLMVKISSTLLVQTRSVLHVLIVRFLLVTYSHKPISVLLLSTPHMAV